MIIFRLVLKEYFKFVGGTVVLCLFLFTLFDFIHKASGYFARYNPSPNLIGKLYLYKIPLQLVQCLPVASLLSSVIVMVLFSRSNEITAMRSFGMSPIKVAAPLGVGGLILSCLSYFASELIVPRSSEKMHHVISVLIEGQNNYSIDDQAHWILNGSTIFNFTDYDHTYQQLHKVKLVEIGDHFYPRKVLHAQLATFNPQTELWKLTGIKQLEMTPDGELSFQPSPESLNIELPINPEKLGLDRRKPDELALRELSEKISINSSRGMDTLSLKIAWHVKLAYPLACFLISLLGLKFGYKSERTTETVRSILLAFGLGISYWFVLSAARALASAGNLPPILAGWIANVIILILVVWQYLSLKKV